VTENPDDSLIVPSTWAAMRHGGLSGSVIAPARRPLRNVSTAPIDGSRREQPSTYV
jgi:hypothetical protein